MKADIQKIMFCIIALIYPFLTHSQTYTLGWQGEDIIPKEIFLDQSLWESGYSEGEYVYTTTDSDAINLHWSFTGGNRNKWIVHFIRLEEPISITDSDIIGIDVKGSECNINRGFSLKFEDGTNQAIFTSPGLASINRWCNRLSIMKNQFQGNIDWSNVRVISFVVSSNASSSDTEADSGTLSLRNLKISNTKTWQRAHNFEHLRDSSLLDSVKNHALQGILNRQVPNGLFYTWKEDNSSWLYGHGLVLKILSLEGKWENQIPVNSSAAAAEKLALFLDSQQQEPGYWPRAWNTSTGTVRMIDDIIWMGDFPWIITGLVNYYKASGDERVLPSIQKAKTFLYSLIEPDGKFYTYDRINGSKVLVTNTESYSAAINSVFELGNSLKAMTMLNYISSATWDSTNLYWKEAISSVRPTLFSATWMSMLNYHTSDSLKAINALSFAGKVLDTHGPGEPEGFDGLGPIAVWYEGTLSYVCAGGPESQKIFDKLINYRFSDGTIPAYNDNLGSKADIWAVNWSSLDATAWLYFAAAKLSPFRQYNPVSVPNGLEQIPIANNLSLFPIPAKDKIYLNLENNDDRIRTISIYNLTGSCLIYKTMADAPNKTELDITSLNNGIYLVKVMLDHATITRKIEILK